MLDAPTPDALKPDAPESDQAMADLNPADSTTPDQGVVDMAAADKAAPDAMQPDKAAPDAVQPDKAAPDMMVADQLAPDASSPIKDPTGILLSKSVYLDNQVAVSGSSAGFIVLWAQGGDLFSAHVSEQASVSLPVSLSSSAGTQAYPAIAYAGTGKNHLAVWEHPVGGKNRIHAARVTTAGKVVDPAPGIQVSDGTVQQVQPAVACSPTECLVVWQDLRNVNGSTYDIYGRRFNPVQGKVTGTGDIMIGTSTDGYLQIPDVAWDGINYLVVWQHPRKGSGEDAYAARVSKAGVLLDTTPVAISQGTDSSSYTNVACDDAGGCLVTWMYGPSGTKEIQGTITTNGTAGLKVTTPGHFTISKKAGHSMFPDVAYSGSDYLVVWQEGASASANIAGARVSKAGKVTSTPLLDISSAANKQSNPAVAMGASLFLVGWDDNRVSTDTNIYAARVGP